MTRRTRIGIRAAVPAVLLFTAVTGVPAAINRGGVPPLAPGGQSTPPDAVDQAFAQLRTYDYDQPRKPLATLELAIAQASGDPQQKRHMADRLTAILADPKAPLAAKAFVCRQLLLVGTDAQVPLLAKMLDDPKAVEMARQTLQGIPGEASGQVLREALGKLKGPALVGLINSLGARRDAKAVDALAALLDSGPPEVASAAAGAIGKIATPQAAAELLKRTANLGAPGLECAERLAAAGDAATAESVYRALSDAKLPRGLRLAALAGLVQVSQDKAVPLVVEALGSKDPLVQATAIRLAKDVRGEGATAALAGQLGKLAPGAQAMLIDALAERGDRAAAPAVTKLIDAKDDAVRVAAIRAMGALGAASDVARLAALAAAQKGAAQEAARGALARMPGADVDRALLADAANGEVPVRVEVIRALAARRTAGAGPVLLAAAKDPDGTIRQSALEALAVCAQADCYPKLVDLLVAAAGADAEAALKAALAVGPRVQKQADRVAPALAALAKASPGAKALLFRLLADCGGPEALAAVRPYVDDADASMADAAVRALAAWADESAAEDLLKLARDSKDLTHRVLALRGYLRLARVAADSAARLKMLQEVRKIATTTDAKKMLLGCLGDVPDAGAMEVASGFLDDAEVSAEAAVAVLKIGKGLMQANRPAVGAAMRNLMEKSKDKDVVAQAKALHAESLKAPRAGPADETALQHDAKRSEALKKELAKTAPKGYHLACYLDCGPDASDGKKGGPTLRVVDGQAYVWPGADQGPQVRFGTIFYSGSAVIFEAAGLNPRKAYQIGFSWWDFDHDTRVQSVWASAGKAAKAVKLLGSTELPSGQKNEPPAIKTLAVPASLSGAGTMSIIFRNEASPNVVVSELWLWESDADGPLAAPAGSPAPPEPQAAPATMPSPKDPKALHVLIVTGIDYPGHKWKQTAPALAEELRKDKRLEVQIAEDPELLASPKLKEYDVVLLHFMPWEKPEPGQEARDNLRRFVEGGKGMVMTHFACGAFPKWPDFVKLAGRVYDPKLRAHDPFGRFTVHVTDVDHPITKGMESFETTDEMYTCLAGQTPITVLADAKSKVDGKMYPMAFVLDCGKGRVFQSPLGHDVKAFRTPGVAELLRRACAWAGGLPPVPK